MDVAIVWDARNFRGDWDVTSGDLLKPTSDIETAVLLSLFTDRIASPDYVPPAGEPPDRHGWWGDTYATALGGPLIGSRLWQLNRAVKSDGPALLARARDYCNEALQWLVSSRVAATVNVQTAWLTRDAIAIAINIVKPDGTKLPFNYQWAWGTSASSRG